MDAPPHVPLSPEEPTPAPRRRRWWLLVLLVIPLGIGAGYLVQQFSRSQVTPAKTPITASATVAPPVTPPTVVLYRLYYSLSNHNGVDGFRTPVLYSVKADGSDKKKHPHPCGQAYAYFEAISPDGTLVAYTDGSDVNRVLFVSKLDGSQEVQLDEWEILDSARFSPDCQTLIYRKSNGEEHNTELNQINVDATGQVQLTSTTDDEMPITFSPDGKVFYYRLGLPRDPKPHGYRVINLATRESRVVSEDDIPTLGPTGITYNIDTTKTGKQIRISVDGDEWDEDETVDDLYLTTPDKKKHRLAQAHQLSVLGWARE